MRENLHNSTDIPITHDTLLKYVYRFYYSRKLLSTLPRPRTKMNVARRLLSNIFDRAE